MIHSAAVKRPLSWPTASPSSERFLFNGIDAVTGSYALPALSPRTLAKRVAGQALDKRALEEARRLFQREKTSTLRKAPIAGVNAERLDEAGWAVIFAKDADPAIRDALGELLAHRRAQASSNGMQRYRELRGNDGYQAGESKVAFLARHRLAAGPADPDRLPYYLLLIGGPEEIPFEIQYQLSVQYAVGRLFFDTLDEYASYARSVVRAERGEFRRAHRAVFFGARNADDLVTQRIQEDLIEPLARRISSTLPNWRVKSRLCQDATRVALARLFEEENGPAFLMTGTHGMSFPCGDPHQREDQGALLCSDWPGPMAWRGPIPRDHYFRAGDVSCEARLAGLLVFHFACYSAGMPQRDDFSDAPREDRRRLSPQPFLARLPQRLLGHPRGGALAVVGHVERAWTWSFRWDEADIPQLQTFESTLRSLLGGERLGHALRYFHQRYAELATDFGEERRRWTDGLSEDAVTLSKLWTAMNDARNYLLLGDPAVRLCADARDEIMSMVHKGGPI